MSADEQTRLARAYQASTETRRGARDGVVVTPVEIVDFIGRSVRDVVFETWGVDLGAEGVTVLDPFTGTGIFPARLIETAPPKEAAGLSIEAWELDPDAAEIARANLAGVAAEHGAPAPTIRAVDTFEQPTHPEDALITGILDRLGGQSWEPEGMDPEAAEGIRAAARALIDEGRSG